MNTTVLIIKKLSLTLLSMSLPLIIFAQSMTFTVTTKTYNGKYSPQHCFALWITDSNGKYVKTINRQSKNYTRYLTNWSNNSGSKTTDGITGATLTSHNYEYTSSGKTTKRIPFNWDFKNYLGNTVADGTYYINIEFTENDATGKYVKYAFTKGSTSYSNSLNPETSSAYFSNATITYTALASAINNAETDNTDIFYSKSDRTLHVYFDQTKHTSVNLKLYNLNGKMIYSTDLRSSGTNIQMPEVSGIYIIKITDKKGWSINKKISL